MALYKDFVVKEGLIVEGITDTLNTTGGALLVGGGAGIGGSLSIGGAIKRFNNVTQGRDHNLGAQLSFRDATFTDELVSGRTSWGILNYFGQSVLDTISANATYTNAASVYIKGAPAAGPNLTIEKAWSVYITSGTMFIGETTGNTATTSSQALQIAGGLSYNNGIVGYGGGNLYGPLFLNNSEVLTKATQNVGLVEFPDGILISTSTNSFSTDTGALEVVGGVGIGKNLYVGGYLAVLTTGTFLSTENAVSTSTGALTIAGGLGVGGDIYAENGIFVSGAYSTSTVGGNSLRTTNGGGLGVSGTGLFEGQVWLLDTTDSTEPDRGALVVKGGVSITRNLTGATAKFIDTTAATDSTSAAVVISGGAAIAKNLIIGSTASSTSSNLSNALIVTGGGSFGGDLKVDGDTVIAGDLILLGTATQVTINSTNTYIADPIIEIGGGVDGAILTIPDIYDKGLLIHYQNAVNTVTDIRAFFGLENTTERFIFKQNIGPNVGGEDPSGDYYTSGTWSTVEAGSLILRDNTTATDGSTGALVVTGGIAINGGSLFTNTLTNDSYAYSLTSIADNAIQVPNGGIGANYLYINTIGYINNSEILTTGTVNSQIGGIFTLTFAFVNETQSISTDTGAITVAGGIGVGGNVNIKGYFNSTGTAHVWAQDESFNTSSGALVVDGGVGIGKRLNVGGALKVYDTTASTGTDTGALIVGGGAGIAGDLNVGGLVSVVNTLTVERLDVLSLEDSINKTTGAVTIAGGLGVGKTINATRINIDTASINSGTNSTSTNTGDLTVVGGVGIGQDVWVGGALKVLSTATASDTTSGAIVTYGGLGVVKDAFIGGTLTRIGNVTKTAWGVNGAGLSLPTNVYADTSSLGPSGNIAIHSIMRPQVDAILNPTFTNASTLYIEHSPVFTGGGSSTSSWSLYVANGNVRINSASSNQGNTTTGALQVQGGVGIGGNLTAAGYVKTTEVLVGPIANSLNNKITAASISGKNTATPVLIDSYIGNEFTTAKYLIQITDLGTPNKFHVVELMVTYDGSASSSGVYISQYGIITNTGELGTFDVDYSAGDIQVLFTPNYTPVSMNLRALRMALVT